MKIDKKYKYIKYLIIAILILITTCFIPIKNRQYIRPMGPHLTGGTLYIQYYNIYNIVIYDGPKK